MAGYEVELPGHDSMLRTGWLLGMNKKNGKEIMQLISSKECDVLFEHDSEFKKKLEAMIDKQIHVKTKEQMTEIEENKEKLAVELYEIKRLHKEVQELHDEMKAKTESMLTLFSKKRVKEENLEGHRVIGTASRLR